MKEFNKMYNESFNQEFCDYLEHQLDKILGKFNDKEINCLACDGITPPFMDIQLTKKNVNDTRQILGVVVFFLGGGNHPNSIPYDMTIKFGKLSLRRYANGSSLIECTPSEESTDWITIDSESKKIEIHLK